MKNILLVDTAFGSFNKGDDIIMEATRCELAPLLEHNFEVNLPSHLPPFHWYQVFKNSDAFRTYKECSLKFIGGSNVMVPNLLTHYPQWNINIFNYQALKGLIMVGVGAGAGAEQGSNYYTKYLYQHMLNRDCYHSARDERSKIYMESLGLKALNTGCVTMWMLTPEFCAKIPTKKAKKVVFTLTSYNFDSRDQQMLDILLRNYEEVYFWPQGLNDFNCFLKFKNNDKVHVLRANKEAYDYYLTHNDTDYVGTRLHGGVYAMRHQRRAFIIAIDERARAINEGNHLNCIEKEAIGDLENLINQEVPTRIVMPFEEIVKWKSQFLCNI